jgi:hypothetical protein
MKKKNLRIIFWVLCILLLWCWIRRYTANNWTKYEYKNWKIISKRTFKNWVEVWKSIGYFGNWEIEAEITYDEKWNLLERIDYVCIQEDWLNGDDIPCDIHYISRILKNIPSREELTFDKDWNILSHYITDWENIYKYDNWVIRTKWNRIWGLEEWLWIIKNREWNELWKCNYNSWRQESWICYDLFWKFNWDYDIAICEYKNFKRNWECKRYDSNWELRVIDHFNDDRKEWKVINYNEDWTITEELCDWPDECIKVK